MKKYRGFEIISVASQCNLEVKLPTRNDVGSSGYDIYSPYDLTIEPKSKAKIPTGIKSYMQTDEELLLFIRSSMAIKYDLELCNNVGKIDSSYYNNPDNEGEIIIAIRNNGNSPYQIKKGDRICQASFYKYLTADNDIILNDIRSGGIGSSGN